MKRMRFSGPSIRMRDEAPNETNSPSSVWMDDGADPYEARFKGIEDTMKEIRDRLDAYTKARDGEGSLETLERNVTPIKREAEEQNKAVLEREAEALRARTGDVEHFAAASAKRWGNPALQTRDGLNPIARFIAASKQRWGQR